MEIKKVKQNLLIKPLKEVINHLVERGFDVKFKNINKIIEEVSEFLSRVLENDKDHIYTMKVKMFIDPEHTLKGELIFSYYKEDYSHVSYIKLEKNEFDFEIEHQKELAGTGDICFELSLTKFTEEKKNFIDKFLQERAKFIGNFETSDDYKISFEVPVKFQVVKYLI
jgi:hypothetical protein